MSEAQAWSQEFSLGHSKRLVELTGGLGRVGLRGTAARGCGGDGARAQDTPGRLAATALHPEQGPAES